MRTRFIPAFPPSFRQLASAAAGVGAHFRAWQSVPVVPLLVIGTFFLPELAAQTVIPIVNFSFETPTPSVFPDYTVGATGWTRTNNTVNSGTFAPGSAMPPVTPTPIDGNQVGYSDGFGGLQQELTTAFTSGYTYTYSVYIGYRSDEVNASVGHGTIELGYLDGMLQFQALSSQPGSPAKGQFDFVSGTYQATSADSGLNIVMRLIDTASTQVLFDKVALTATATAIPEPAAIAVTIGAVVLAFAALRRRRRDGPAVNGSRP